MKFSGEGGIKMKRIKNLLIFVLIISLFSSLAACGETSSSGSDTDGSSGTTITLTLSQSAVTLAEDESVLLSADTNSGKTVRWESDRPEVAIVSGGMVRAVGEGTATITATVEGVSASCAITVVSEGNKGVFFIQPDKEKLTLVVGQTEKLTPVLYELSEGASTEVQDAAFAYSSSDESVVTVSADGTVTTVGEGEATIAINSEDITVYVEADIYGQTISTEEEWLGMFGTHGKKYLLVEDLDFEGISYRGYFSGSATEVSSEDAFFDNTVNGNGHTVSNITFQYDGSSMLSIFGYLINGVVENISFENILFAGTNGNLGNCAGIAFRAFGTETRVSNVSLGLRFDTVCNRAAGAGIVQNIYSGVYENILVQISSPGASSSGDRIYGIAETTYAWTRAGEIDGKIISNRVPSVENIVVFSGTSDNVAAYSGSVTPPQVIGGGVEITASVMDAAWFAYNNFDTALWDVYPNAFPELKVRGEEGGTV